jgi:CheY-like chemotaxis protein
MSRSEPLGGSVTILLADDDEDDRELIRDALPDSDLAQDMKCAVDGQDLLDYLRHQGRWAESGVDAPRPAIILLDLNMPKMDGREALAEIKRDDSLRRIPVVVLTTSKDEIDVFSTYDLGVSSYITKPATFAELTEIMRAWTRYWFEVVELPNGEVLGYRRR